MKRLLWFIVPLAACHAPPPVVGRSQEPTPSPAAERGYHRPPEAISAAPDAGGSIILEGTASAGARVRLTTPEGPTVVSRADSRGRWRVSLPRPTRVRLLSLSMIEAGTTIRSEGYLVVPPVGPAAQLRSGSGAMVFVGGFGGPRLLAIDFDRKGGTLISGAGPRAAVLTIDVDGATRDRATVDGQGRFSVALGEPLTAGRHAIGVALGAIRAEVIAPFTPSPARAAPFLAQRIDAGWRIDWLTPGGGAQTTILVDSADPARSNR